MVTSEVISSLNSPTVTSVITLAGFTVPSPTSPHLTSSPRKVRHVGVASRVAAMSVFLGTESGVAAVPVSSWPQAGSFTASPGSVTT